MDSVDYYNAIVGSYDKLYHDEQKQKIDKLIEIVKPEDGESVLDIGAGTGILERELRRVSITALEPSELANNIRSGEGSKLTVVRKKVVDFESDKKFDLIFCITVLQDIPEEDRKAAIEKIFSFAKEGSRIAISVLRISDIDLSYMSPGEQGEIANDRYYIFYK